mmetsp:Transcript_80661/g.211759  ORF Transcript_80661/g.211759 Transcript_80661/m.211759 type:complete len:289 (+) Transcript_80661:617-1483(+)
MHGLQIGGVVAGRLHSASAHRGGPIVRLADQSVHALLAAGLAEVSARREHGDHEGILLGEGREAQHLPAGEEQGADVHGGLVSEGRDELYVALHGLAHALDKHLGGHLGHAELVRAPLHALRVLHRIHDADLPVLARKRFHPLKDGDAVVQGAAVDVQQHVGGGHEDATVPSPGFPGVLDVAVERSDLEAEAVPLRGQVLHLGLHDRRSQEGVDLLVGQRGRRRRVDARELHVRARARLRDRREGPGPRGRRPSWDCAAPCGAQRLRQAAKHGSETCTCLVRCRPSSS